MESVRNGLYALALAVVASTLIFSWSLTTSANTIGEGLVMVAKQGGTPSGGGTAVQPTQQPSQPSQPTAPEPQPTAAGKLDFASGAARGTDGAKVVLVEFSDFQCPFCKRFVDDAYVQVKKDYVDTGKVQLVYMDFPLDSIHPQARPAANAAKCVRKLGGVDKFWEYHDKLFANQASLSDENYKKWAGEVGIDAAQFASCYDAKAEDGAVTAEFTVGANAGIRGTPGFIITKADGSIITEVSGAQPYAVFKAALDSALASA